MKNIRQDDVDDNKVKKNYSSENCVGVQIWLIKMLKFVINHTMPQKNNLCCEEHSSAFSGEPDSI